MTRSTRIAAAALLALAASWGTAQAQSAGDWVLGAGALHYAPQDRSQPLQVTQPPLGPVPGSGANVKGTTTLGLNVHYFLTDHWAVEGVLGIPPRIKLDGAGANFGQIGRLGSARLWAPTVLGKYFFGELDDRLRFSLGAGLTYNDFRSVRLNSAGLAQAMAPLGVPGNAVTTASIGSKWAPVFNVGVSYAIDRHWGISGSISYMPLKLRANLDTRLGGQTLARSTTKIRVNPVLPFVYVTYRF